MCRLLHIEWRCTHEQTVWEFCRDSPPRRNKVKRPCSAFLNTFGPAPAAATDTEYRNHCCQFSCCIVDQADLYAQVLALEDSLGLKYKQRLPFLFRNKQEKNLKKLRRQFKLLEKRHDGRCEALYYGLGWVEGLDQVRIPMAARATSGSTVESEREGKVRGHLYTRSEGGLAVGRVWSLSPEVVEEVREKARKRVSAMSAPP